MVDERLTKRQREILERLQEGMPVKRIATDLGVSRNAVYLQIDRLRRDGVLPATFTPSGQPPRNLRLGPDIASLELGAAVPAPGFGPGPLPGEGPAPAGASELAAARRPHDAELDPVEHGRMIEAAAARRDVATLAYELGRLDATARTELATGLVEAALERLGVLPGGGPPADPPGAGRGDRAARG